MFFGMNGFGGCNKGYGEHKENHGGCDCCTLIMLILLLDSLNVIM